MVKIRKLKTADVFRVIGMLKNCGNTRLNNLIVADMTAAKTDKPVVDNSVQIGIMVLTEIYDNVIGDLQEWFASLIGVSHADYMEMPANTTLEIIDELVSGEDAKGFFSQALQLYKKMQK